MNLTNWDAFPYSLYNRTYKSEIASGPNAFRSFGFSVQFSNNNVTLNTSYNSNFSTLEIGINSLSFGRAYYTVGVGCEITASFQSLLPENIENQTAILALDFVGLGLNKYSYEAFSHMLATISNNQFDCAIQTPENNFGVFQGTGSCIAPSPCSSFNQIWDTYMLNITFPGKTDYLLFPISIFA